MSLGKYGVIPSYLFSLLQHMQYACLIAHWSREPIAAVSTKEQLETYKPRVKLLAAHMPGPQQYILHPLLSSAL